MFVLRNYYVSKDLRAINPYTLFRKLSVISNKASVDRDESEDNREVTVRFSEKEIAAKRNKSMLRTTDRNILHDEIPYPEPSAEHHHDVKYKRRLFGRYGNKSGVDPLICWPSLDDMSNMKEYESLSRPHTLEEMVRMNNESKAAEQEQILKREEEVANKLAKLEKWKAELDARLKKKEADAAAAKAKKDRLIEEVRRHFGFKVDPKDDRFKEMLEKKEKEEKKLVKEAKKKAREAKLLSHLVEVSKKSDVQKPT